MPTTLIKLVYDHTGILPANKVIDEIHLNIDVLSKMIIPKLGRFFTESVIVTDGGSITLVKNTDYVFGDFDQQESLKVGKEIAKSIIVINDNLGVDYEVTYQALGGDFGYSNDNLIACIQDKVLPYAPVQWTDVKDKPYEFPPIPGHLHGMDTIYGFEFIAKELLRIKHSVEVSCFPSYESMVGYCDAMLIKLQQDMLLYLEANMDDRIADFKSKFNKEYFQIESLANLKTAKEKEGYDSGNSSYNNTSYNEDLYFTLEALVGLKRALYEKLVSKLKSGIGLTTSNYETPTRGSLLALGNGFIKTLISKDAATGENVTYEANLYPPPVPSFSEPTVQKVTNNLTNGGGLFLSFNPSNNGLQLFSLETEDNFENVKWRSFCNAVDVDGAFDSFRKHIVNFDDPHRVTKGLVGLSLVEDLPVVTESEVQALRSTRKYITFDLLIKFLEAYMIDKNLGYQNLTSSKNDETNTSPDYLIDNCVVVYSPPGEGCKKQTAQNDCVDPPVLPPSTSPPTTRVTTTRLPTTSVTPTTSTTAPTTSSSTAAPTSTTVAPTTSGTPTTSKPPVLRKTITVELGPVASYGLLGTMIGFIQLDTGSGVFTYGFTGNYITYNKSDHDLSTGSSDYSGYVSFRTAGGAQVLLTNEGNRAKIAPLYQTYHYQTNTALNAAQFNSITKAYYERSASGAGGSGSGSGSGLSSSS